MIPKFRAFVKETKTIHEVISIDFHNGSVTLKNDPADMPWRCYGDDETDVILMQSTGLHDKNDMEICEGDVVEINLSSLIDGATKKQLCIVIYSNGSYTLKSIHKIELPWFANSLLAMHKDALVIGNIHENPELLENKTIFPTAGI